MFGLNEGKMYEPPLGISANSGRVSPDWRAAYVVEVLNYHELGNSKNDMFRLFGHSDAEQSPVILTKAGDFFPAERVASGNNGRLIYYVPHFDVRLIVEHDGSITLSNGDIDKTFVTASPSTR